MKKAVIYGAGNIGRGFIGQLFFQSGCEVVFIDINTEIVDGLNRDRSYPIRILSDQVSRDLIVENVRAVNGGDMDAASAEISTADIMATAVGVNVLPKIARPLADGLKKRWNSGNYRPLNIIICENLLDANHYLAELIKNELSDAQIKCFNKTVGLVEASIGRMVPVMTPEMQDGNPLRICVEEYGELPVDGDAFKGGIPSVVNMIPFSPFEYFIQRKLFIHNMGHAVTAYMGYLKGYRFIWEAIGDPAIRQVVYEAMKESANALSMMHGVQYINILEHADDLIRRFDNRQLGDTIERVGKDPVRKLSSNDRLVGAARLCAKNGVKPVYICRGIAAALCFSQDGDAAAARVQEMLRNEGLEAVLEKICGLSRDESIRHMVEGFYSKIKDDGLANKVKYISRSDYN